MNFVDELNNIPNKQYQNAKKIEALSNDIIEYLKRWCLDNANEKSLKGYIGLIFDSDYGFSIFRLEKELPTVDIWNMNKRNRKYPSQILVLESGITKSRLYKDMMCFENEKDACYFSDLFTQKLLELGFKQNNYIITIKRTEDLYLICKQKKGIFFDSKRYYIKPEGYVYVIYFQLSW